jgi:hypothetical protein
MAKKRGMRPGAERASAGHKLGQLVGDWFEQYFVYPLLQRVADRLSLYLDSRFRAREAGGGKLVWLDEDKNAVDYDFVMEMDGTAAERGIPVAFFESFWRRGSRHSKDKARDDSGKLLPMRNVHPTARFLGIVAGGDFTTPAKQLVQSRGIDLFYVPKAKIVSTFESLDMTMDYSDQASEKAKMRVLNEFERRLSEPAKLKAAVALRDSVGQPSLDSYFDRVRGALGALPQEIRFIARSDSSPAVFESIADASNFLKNPEFGLDNPSQSFVYQVAYTDGSEFERAVSSLESLREVHFTIERLAQYVASLSSQVEEAG